MDCSGPRRRGMAATHRAKPPPSHSLPLFPNCMLAVPMLAALSLPSQTLFFPSCAAVMHTGTCGPQASVAHRIRRPRGDWLGRSTAGRAGVLAHGSLWWPVYTSVCASVCVSVCWRTGACGGQRMPVRVPVCQRMPVCASVCASVLVHRSRACQCVSVYVNVCASVKAIHAIGLEAR